MDAYITLEAQSGLRTLRLTDPEAQPGTELPKTVVVRADKQTPFYLLNHIIKTCQTHGFRKFQYRAMSALPEA